MIQFADAFQSLFEIAIALERLTNLWNLLGAQADPGKQGQLIAPKTVQVTIRLDGMAPAGEAAILFTSTGNVAPPSLPIPAGCFYATIPVTIPVGLAGPVSITATYRGVSKTLIL